MNIKNEIRRERIRIKNLREQNASLAKAITQHHRNVLICLERAGGKEDSRGAFNNMACIERIAQSYCKNERAIGDSIQRMKNLHDKLDKLNLQKA